MKSRTISLLLTILFVAAAISVARSAVQGEKTDLFYTNSGTTVKGGPIDLTPGGGMDSQYYFRVGNNVPISYANFKISTRYSGNGMAIQSPYIDVGVDGNREWAYDDVGYGKFGEQNFFSDGKDRKSMDFSSSGGYNSANSIYIPQGADIDEAEIAIKGRFIPQSISNYKIMADPSSVSMTGYAMEHGDIDGDGDTDIVVSDTKNYRIIWFENPNSTSGKWNVHTVYSGSTYIYNVYSIDVGDMDGDGDLDVVATSYSRYYVMYIRNNGQGNSWTLYRFKT
ncbi:MAG: VCBS repeat-containing protein, partial [Candidatus Thermoplasmatota archaeon]|nr:VCBS repeat-containing protein [Candidatus Thermoplasmatota archaeon]